MKKIRSRQRKRNEITIILETEENNCEVAEREIRKTIRKLNRLFEDGLGFKILIG